jgi:hypothetical protein
MLFDPTFRRSDSDLYRSRNAWRVRGLVLALGMVLISIQFASRPENWRWLTNEPRARPQAAATRAARPNGTETADDEPLGRDEIRAVPDDDPSAKRSISVEVGASRPVADVHLPSELFDNVSETRIGIRQDEREAYFTVLAKARDLRLPVLEAAGRHDIGYVELFNDPEAHRGDVVTVEGQLRRLIELPAGDNSHGFQTLYEGWLFTEDSGPNPFRLVFSRLPEGIPTGERVRLAARFTGYFFKRSGYVNKAGDLHSAPLLLGKTIRWEPATPLETGVSMRTLFIVIGLVAGLCLCLVMLMRQVSSSDDQFQRQRRRQLAAIVSADAFPPSDVEVIDPREELRRLSEQAEQEHHGVGSLFQVASPGPEDVKSHDSDVKKTPDPISGASEIA